MKKNLTKVSEMIEILKNQDGNIQYNIIDPLNLEFPPFLDIDTADVFFKFKKWINDKKLKELKLK